MAPTPPFVVCDPRRGNTGASVRSPANLESAGDAFRMACDGTLCMRADRLPRDFASAIELVRDPASRVQLVVCWHRDETHPLLVSPAPITVPPLRDRAGELARIVDEYAVDAIMALGVLGECFTTGDRNWVLQHAAASLEEIEKATLRLVALATSASVSRTAERLEMAQVSLARWIGRRGSPQSAATRITSDA